MFKNQRVVVTTTQKIFNGTVSNLTKLDRDSLRMVDGNGKYIAIVQDLNPRIIDILGAMDVLTIVGDHDADYYNQPCSRIQETLANYAELVFCDQILTTKDQMLIRAFIPSPIKRVFANVWNNRTKWEEEKDDEYDE